MGENEVGRAHAAATDGTTDTGGQRGLRAGQTGDGAWELVGGAPESRLDALAGEDLLNIYDTGMGGWVVMNGGAEPLLFIGERSSWYGKLLAGRAREATYDLLDTCSRPIARMDKAFGLTSSAACVSLCRPGPGPAGPVWAASALQFDRIGTVDSEWHAIKRRLVLRDAIPNHAAGTVALESPSVFDDTFRIMHNDSVIGAVFRPRNGMGIATIQLDAGALDPFRANRMRSLILCATLLVCDLHWQLVPGPSTLLKMALPFR